VTSKPELLAQLTNAKNNYVLGLAALSLFATPEVYPMLEAQHAAFGTYTVEVRQVAALLRVGSDRDIAVKEFLTMLLRALIKESFELIRTYAEETGQSAIVKSQSWYQFARLIRNCISHNFQFAFRPYDESILPVTWGSRTMVATMQGQPLPLNFFGYVEAWELFKEFHAFATDRLK
jgi:hypothetical protein